VPVNGLKKLALQDSGIGALFSRLPDDDTDPRLKPWALIDEVDVVVLACGKIAYRGIR